MNAFLPADILMPKTDHMEKWAVIACDQFTSDQAYWDRVRKNAEGAVSTINLILPEAELGTEKEAKHTAEINATMKKYMEDGVFTVYPHSFVYVERTLENGSVREGLVGMVDLDAYDYTPGATSAIRATERTVPERIPPRQRVRRDAPIELPHVLMLCDDHDKKLIEPIAAKKDSLKKLYDFDLMEDGGHITGWLVEGKDVEDFNKALTEYTAAVGEKYTGLKGTPMVFAVGDGNHSLATAKSCYEELKKNNPGVDLSNHPAHPIWQNPYVAADRENSYCGLVNIYNFLSDSFKFNRNADEGYLIGRIFINRERRYFAEGKQQNSMRAMDFGKSEIGQEALVAILESAIGFALNFDLLMPPYEENKRVTVDQFNTKMDNSKFVTGKRLGYDFDVEDI